MGVFSRLRKIALVLLALGLILVGIWLVRRVRRQPQQPQGPSLSEQVESHRNLTPTIRPNPATIIRHIQNLRRLETAFYSIEKVITAETGQDSLSFLFGDRLLFVAHGEVIAGVDLERVQEDDITVTADDEVVMVVPPAEVFIVALDNDQSFVYDRDTGVFGLNQELETEARRAAEEEILDAALEDGILDMADANARAYLEELITGLGFQGVRFIEATPTPVPPTLPVTVVPPTATP